MKIKTILITGLSLLLISFAFVSTAQTDSIVFTNGNYMVGEIKKMSMGVMQIETDYSDSDFKTDWELIEYIKNNKEFSNVSIIAVTGLAASFDEFEKVDKACDAVLHKSDFELNKFTETVKSLLTK